MSVITEKINKILNEKKLSRYQISKMINYDDSAINAMILNKKPFSETVIKKFLPIIKVSREEFEGWILADKYPKEVLNRAIQVKKEFPYKKISILTVNIDKILKEKEISRAKLAKQIKYSQSSLNSMIISKINMSKPVLEKLSENFEIPQNEILSWIVADKYELELLEKAFNNLS